MARKEHLPESAPLVAIVGRPNVGKSTLFNRLVGGHDAIVEDKPGVTRDRRYGATDYSGVRFRVVDTGGLDTEAAKEASAALWKGVWRQAMRAVEEAAVVVFVTDVRQGLTPQDREVAERLRKMSKTVLYAANKADSAKLEDAAAEVYSLGAESVFPISAAHGRGLSELLDAVVAALPEDAPRTDDPIDEDEPDRRLGGGAIRIAFVGRPNAGKSSLVNALCGDERMIVDDTPGTTRDPVDTPVEIDGHKYLIIDTAGIRRRAKVYEPMEKVAVAMAEKAVGRADVAVLVIDAQAGIGEQDAKIAGLVHDQGKALIICFNKRDLVDAAAEKRLHEDRERILQFVPWAFEMSCSALKGTGIKKLLAEVRRCYGGYNKRISTGALNRFFEGIVERHPPPLFNGKPIKLYYITQTQVRPPTFMVSVNYPQGMHFSYQRYLQNQIRETFDFVGTPVRIVAREHSGKRSRRRESEE